MNKREVKVRVDNKRKKMVSKDELRKMGYLPIREVAKRAGVEKSTVHFYLSEGLLPKPVMVSSQMAYYPPETVERIKLIKQLQKRFLPLKEIKRIIKGGLNIKEILERIDERILSFDSFGKTTSELSQDVSKDILKELERIGLVKSAENPSFYDIQIAKVVQKMRDVGLNEKLGFSFDFLRKYLDICKELVDIEFEEFNSKVIGKLDPDTVVELAKGGIEGTSELIGLLHRKMLFEKLEELQKELKEEFKNKEEKEGEEEKKVKNGKFKTVNAAKNNKEQKYKALHREMITPKKTLTGKVKRSKDTKNENAENKRKKKEKIVGEKREKDGKR